MSVLLSGSAVGLTATSSKRAHATCCVSQVCCSQRPCPRRRPLLTHASSGDTQTLRVCGSVSVGSLGPGVHKLLFEPSKHLWWVWDLILNVILHPPQTPLSCWGLSFALGRGLSFFSGIQHSPVDGCSAVSCNSGVLTEDGHTSFYSAILKALC